GQPEIDTLVISASEPGSLEYLPTLPKLRRLVIGNWDSRKAGPLPAGLHGLKSLVIGTNKMTDLSVLKTAPAGLEELTICNVNESVSLAGLENMSNLRALILMMDKDESAQPLPDLAALPKLRWLGLPPWINQEQLASVVKSLPDLEILQLTETEKPIDLAPLGGLGKLYGLVLGGTYKDLDIVRTLKSLRFLGISEESWPESPEEIAAIRAALPDAVVIRIEPTCLGSGWLLLFLPLLGLAWLRHQRRQPPARAA
ncbi:MAG: hypothetical protein OEW16_13525, partial [Gammaproteobacteria bacterium]|nr:hypothetical protein [Gammaproteobacteria bacterium]